MSKATTFSKEFLKEIEQLLLKEKARLEKELGQFTVQNPNDSDNYTATYPQYGDKEDENAQEVAQYAVDKSLEETMEKALRDVKKTLIRITEGTYGICKYCDKPIAEQRLKARPTSGSCVDCKKTLTEEA